MVVRGRRHGLRCSNAEYRVLSAEHRKLSAEQRWRRGRLSVTRPSWLLGAARNASVRSLSPLSRNWLCVWGESGVCAFPVATRCSQSRFNRNLFSLQRARARFISSQFFEAWVV